MKIIIILLAFVASLMTGFLVHAMMHDELKIPPCCWFVGLIGGIIIGLACH